MQLCPREFALAVTLSLWSWLSIAAGPAAAQQAASTIIILDGSNSMNGRLANDKAFKFATVRDAMRGALPKAGANLGLVTFGARRLSDCTDVDVAVPLSPGPGPVIEALERFQPRGFSPVVLALRTAAKAISAAAGKHNIVLVLDDLASCRGEDPCAVAADLKRQNPALTIHVVGLGLKPADASVLACIVRQTGGRLFEATDGPSVAPAMEQAFVAAGGQTAGQSAAPELVAAAPAKPAVDRIDSAAVVRANDNLPGLHLSARLTDSGPPLLIPVEWRILRQGVSGQEDPVHVVSAAFLSRELPVGRYLIDVRAGLVSVTQPVEITSSAPMPVSVSLNAARLGLSLSFGNERPANAADVSSRAVMSVQAHRPAGEVRTGETSWIERASRRDLIVPPGSYLIAGEDGLVRAAQELTVAAGDNKAVSLILKGGRLVLETPGRPVGPGQPAHQLIVEEDDPDIAGGRREVIRSVMGPLDVALPVGAYRVSVSSGVVQTFERVVVRPGELVRRSLALGGMRVRLVARMGSTLPAGLAVTYKIERIDGASRALIRDGDPEAVMELPPGRYRIESRIGGQNAMAVREVDVRSGDARGGEVRGSSEQRIELDTGAGSVQLRIGGGMSGLGFGEVFWQVFDDQGRVVWRTGAAAPVLALLPGRYRTRADVRGRNLEREFDVRTGESGVVEVGG